MASVVKTKAGYMVQLSPNEDTRRPKINLGRVPKGDAQTARNHIAKLIKLRDTGADMDDSTTKWLYGVPGKKEGITPGLRARLEAFGIIERPVPLETGQQDPRKSVSYWVDYFIETHTKEGSDNRRKITNVGNRLKLFFGEDKIADVTVEKAKLFRKFIGDEPFKLEENTIRRHIGICRQIFNGAIDAGLIEKNPFLGQAVTVQPNKSRFFYVTPEHAQKVLDAMPNAEWRLIFGLARWGGLRCPSEVVALKWSDIDFDKEEFIVHSPKTERHVGHDQRTVPMFPELKPLFQDAYDAAPEGAVYCVNRYKDGKEVNLRTQFDRILEKAKIESWQKPFQNCRSTRESELFKLTNGNVKAVCSWIGNSPEIALKHYAQLQEADVKEAARKSILSSGKIVVHHLVHGPCETGCNGEKQEKYEQPENARKYQDLQGFAGCCNDVQNIPQWAEVDSNHRRR